MNDGDTQTILANRAFQTLVRRRNRFGFALVAVMVVTYFGFILLVVFNGAWLGRPAGSGPITIGLWLGLAVMAVAFGVTGLYVRQAHREFDVLTRRLFEDLR